MVVMSKRLLHSWSRVNGLSQVKQRPKRRRSIISAEVRCLIGRCRSVGGVPGIVVADGAGVVSFKRRFESAII